MPGAGVGGICPVGVGFTGIGLQVGLHFAFVGHLVGHFVGHFVGHDVGLHL